MRPALFDLDDTLVVEEPAAAASFAATAQAATAHHRVNAEALAGCGTRAGTRVVGAPGFLAPHAPIDLWRSRYPDKALVGAEHKAREREARGKQLRYGLSLQRRHARARWRLLAEG